MPTLGTINNIIKGVGIEYEDLITFPGVDPIDWTEGEKISNGITEDDALRIGMLRKRVQFGVGGIPTNMYVANASEWIDDEFVISRRDYQKALSDGLNRLLTSPDEEGGREFIETIDIMSKAFLIPKRDLYRYLDGSRTINVFHAYNIINFFGMRPQCLLGNFSMFVVENCDD